ncbi:hypothetical protein RBA09_30095, partial [Massilia sp. CCM 9029]|nr:hypothetical protein [Massilia sp. CCM 9029]
MSAGNGLDALKLTVPSGKDPKGNFAFPVKTVEDGIAEARALRDAKQRLNEVQQNVDELKDVLDKQEKAVKQKEQAKQGAPKKAAQTRHIAHVGNWRAVAIEPDLCRIGKCVVAFNSYSLLPEMTAGAPNVTACGTRVLRKGDLIKGVESNAGQNIASGRSLDTGYLAILEGHRNVKSNGLPVARDNSLCRINTNEGGAVGPLARMMTVAKPVAAAPAAVAEQPPPGKRTSKRLEELKAQKAKVDDGLLNFDTSDEFIRFKDLNAMANDAIGQIKAEPGTLLDHGAQAVRGGAGLVKDMLLGVGELAYEGAKAIPKTLQSRFTPSGVQSGMLDNAIFLENLRIGNITPGTIGQSVIDFGAAVVKPVTDPLAKGQTTEAVVRGGLELASLPFAAWTKAGKAKK